MIATWDDHEVSNDQWSGGAGGHDRGEGSWRVRRAHAHRAYDEWMPAALDGTARLDDSDRIFRSLPFGRLFDLHMLDLRSYRDEQVANMFEPGAVDDPERTITGQRAAGLAQASTVRAATPAGSWSATR